MYGEYQIQNSSEELGLWNKNVTRYLPNKICDIEKKKQQKNSSWWVMSN
jgi:hypothetical protein